MKKVEREGCGWRMGRRINLCCGRRNAEVHSRSTKRRRDRDRGSEFRVRWPIVETRCQAEKGKARM